MKQTPDPSRIVPAPVFAPAFDTKRAWRRGSISADEWVVPLPTACIDELEEVAAILRSRRQAVEALRDDDLRLPACREFMATVRGRLEYGAGFCVLDRVPVERMSVAELRVVYWALARALSNVVAQKWDGTSIYDVLDKKKTLAYGVRRSITNLSQPFHTDGGWLTHTPHFVALACIKTSSAGGISRVSSLLTAHDIMLREAPDLLERLYRPFCWDRQAEHPLHESKYSRHAVFHYDATLAARFYEAYIQGGHEVAGEPLDSQGVAALAYLRGLLESPHHFVEFALEPGQIQYLNNRQIVHSRTSFEDGDGGAGGRHLIRLWSRGDGARSLEGRSG